MWLRFRFRSSCLLRRKPMTRVCFAAQSEADVVPLISWAELVLGCKTVRAPRQLPPRYCTASWWPPSPQLPPITGRKESRARVVQGRARQQTALWRSWNTITSPTPGRWDGRNHLIAPLNLTEKTTEHNKYWSYGARSTVAGRWAGLGRRGRSSSWRKPFSSSVAFVKPVQPDASGPRPRRRRRCWGPSDEQIPEAGPAAYSTSASARRQRREVSVHHLCRDGERLDHRQPRARPRAADAARAPRRLASRRCVGSRRAAPVLDRKRAFALSLWGGDLMRSLGRGAPVRRSPSAPISSAYIGTGITPERQLAILTRQKTTGRRMRARINTKKPNQLWWRRRLPCRSPSSISGELLDFFRSGFRPCSASPAKDIGAWS